MTLDEQNAFAEAAEWLFVGNGKKLHAFFDLCLEANGIQIEAALCGKWPPTLRGSPWIDAMPCDRCLAILRKIQAKKGTQNECSDQ